MSKEYTPKQIADFIAKYANNNEVKNELKKHGYNIVPNSLSKLIKNLEKIGYSITKIEKPTTKNKTIQLFGAKSNVEIEEETNKSDVDKNEGIIDPFSDGYINKQNKEVIKNKDMEEELEQENEIKTFNHYTKPKEEPTDPKLRLWEEIKKHGKNQRLSFYSLLASASLLELNNEKIKLGFVKSRTYQMNQLKRDNNMEALNKTIRDVIGKPLHIELETISNNINDTLLNEDVEPYENKEIQILGDK